MESFKIISRSKELGSTKSLLKKGLVPGIIYGKNTDSTKIVFENTLDHKPRKTSEMRYNRLPRLTEQRTGEKRAPSFEPNN